MESLQNYITSVYGKDYKVLEYTDKKDRILIGLKSLLVAADCPSCGVASGYRHGTRTRFIADTPIRNKVVVLRITGNQWRCDNADCGQKIFLDKSFMGERRAKRTLALDQFILAIAFEFSSEGASRILKRLGVKASNDTIDRLIAKIKIVDNPNVESIGVDDFAYRKGISYCTAIYDMDTHRPIAILDGRDGKELKQWLAGHKKVTIVARDRDATYAKVITEALPNARQVADKFHLMQNIIRVIKEVLAVEIPKVVYVADGEVTHKKPITNAKTSLKGVSYTNDPIINEETGEIMPITGRTRFSKDYLSLKKN